MPLTLPSFAKVNLMLRVIGKRGDGFHELFTVFQAVSLKDVLHFEEQDEISLECDDRSVPGDESNLVLKAAALLKERYGVHRGARMVLEKHIPSPGGLGGGSSNAAVTLIALNRLWGIGLSQSELCSLGAELGSDVPFFIYGGTAIGTGRGEAIEPIEDKDAPFMLIVTPDIAVSTREAFSKLGASTLTNAAVESILPVCRLQAGSLDLRRTELKNDLEESVFSSNPEIRRVKTRLMDLGAVNAAMSGSGASVFAIFDNKETRQAAEKALDDESTWRKFAVSTISRENYREALAI